MAVINGVDTSTINYDELGRYLRSQPTAASGLDFGALDRYMQAMSGQPQLTMTEQANIANQRRQANDLYGNSLANLEFQRGNALANQSLDTQNLTTQWDRTRERLPGGYAHRGLLNSGIYGQGLQNYATDRLSAFRNLQSKYQQQLGSYDLQKQQAVNQHASTFAGIDTTEQAARADLAAQLRGLQ